MFLTVPPPPLPEAPCGGPSLSDESRPVFTPPPFLTLDQRLEYLVRKNYLFDGIPSDDARESLGNLNFHYFLGYARNYRQLGSRSVVRTDGDVLERMLSLVELDRELSIVVFHGLRRLEWRLRALLVQHHCELFPTTACFLDPGHYRVLKPDLPPIELSLLKHIERSREPYLVEHFDAGRSVQDLPIWAVVDTWTFGDLSRLVSETIPLIDPHTGEERRLWKGIAQSLGVSASTIIGNLETMSVLRNLVAHHSRLWMRPMTIMPRIPKYYPAQLRRKLDSGSLYGAFLALAELLGPRGDGQLFLDDVKAILARDPAFKLGITNPVSKADHSLEL